MAGLVNLQDALHPCNDLVRGGVGWLVEVDHTIALELEERSSGGRPATGEGREVSCLDVKLVKVLKRRDGLGYLKVDV